MCVCVCERVSEWVDRLVPWTGRSVYRVGGDAVACPGLGWSITIDWLTQNLEASVIITGPVIRA